MKKKSLILFISMFLGILCGLFFKDFSIFIKPLGTLFINLLFQIVVPLVFFTIATSIMKNKKYFSNTILKILKYFVLTSLVATLVMLIAVLVFNPAKDLTLQITSQTISSNNFLESFVNALSVNDFNLLLSKNNILALILFAIAFGYYTENEKISNTFESITNTLLKIVDLIMYYAPIGIFAFLASTTSEYGESIIKTYGLTMLLYYVVSFLYFFIFNFIYSYSYNKMDGVKMFFKEIIPSFICSMSTQSSLATLPTNIMVAKRMKLNNEVTDISLPLGSTIHMEGSCMSAVLKIVFLFTVFGMDFLNPTSIILCIIISIISGIVMSGIPGGGLIGEALIVSMYGFPEYSLAYLATIGWLVDMPATMLNATGDISSSMLICKNINN
jgi:Na+/H+-dicarboxylate symporter